MMESRPGEETGELSPKDHLLKTVREICTLGDRIPVYAEAEIELREFDPSELHPTALYLLEPNMKFVRQMHKDLLSVGINDFKLDCVVKWGPYTVAPPLVEWIDGKWAIVDGGHRVKNAKDVNESKISVVTIKGPRVDKPFISLPVNWNEVVTYRERPSEESRLRKMLPGFVGQKSLLADFFRDASVLVGQPARRKMAFQNA